MQNMTVVRALTSLWSQRPSLPARSLIDRSRVDRRRHHGVHVTWIDGARAAQATIVHLHGGAYLHGERPAHWEWLEEITRRAGTAGAMVHYRMRSEEHTSELQSRGQLVCRLLLENKHKHP